ncbi:uncharacterized protein LOC143304429 [Bombus vancouverensis nearcticus]|uniref:uncharacterized protein LOC143304429 n=1 Tax=Bombus vancouverensis nearcticus TaxID=2705178 RepID=UPI00402B5395
MAMKRLISLCRRFQRDKRFEADYRAVIQEYVELGHMTKITTDNCTDDGYFLPHHGVIKESSQTTKLRVVFDGSAPTTTGVSLNDVLHTGPKLQDDLFFILLRFRSHQYVITGDVEKMYRQFLVRPEDRKFQQILWRNSDGEVDSYQLNTVTFGLSAAPDLAIRCLKQLADDGGHRYPRAATVLQRDFYVDDVLTGVDRKVEARSWRTELTELLELAGLNIRKWASNDRELLRGLSEQDINDKLLLGESQTFKTLGVVWNSFDDSILYSVKINSTASRITKRTISSEIAKIYDPLGLLPPVIVRAKMLLQRLWTLKIDWDESLPADVHTEWSSSGNELHGFCDASERAYGACVYLRIITPDGHVWTRLLTAKSKVAPLKSQTIPRLELSGALLLASLATTVLQALPSNISRTVYWTDSTIVLHWINTSPHTLKTFVANRVTEIQQKTHTSDWRHIPAADNPADLISRGQSPEDFLRPTIWQHGPEWLQQPERYWPTWNPVPLTEISEQKKATCLATQTTLKVTTFNEPSDLKKEKVSPGDKSIQKVISPNLLQNVHDSLTVVHNLESNGLSPIQDSNKVNVESKPTVKASKSTVNKPSRGSVSSANTYTMDVQHNVSTSNHLSYITSSAPPQIRNIASDSHTPRRNVKTPPSPPQTCATPAIGPTQNNFSIINTMTNHSNGVGNLQNILSDLNDSLLSSQSAVPN